jgi:hypothetical protein
MIWQLIAHAGHTPPNRSGFPIFHDSKGYEARKQTMIKGIAGSAARIDALQPFHRGATFQADPLWMLQELNNIDKHRLLLVTRAFLGHGNYEFETSLPYASRRVLGV